MHIDSSYDSIGFMQYDFYSSSPYDYLFSEESQKSDSDWIRNLMDALRKSPKLFHLFEQVIVSVEDILDWKKYTKSKSHSEKNNSLILEGEIQYQYLLSDFHIWKQKPHSAHCGHLNVEWLLNYLSQGKQQESHFEASSTKIWLLPESFIKIFDEYSPKEFSIDIIHPEEKDLVAIVEKQIQAWLPVPIIYIPLGWMVKFPHYATIVGIWKNKEGAKVFRIEDSLREYISRDFLTEKELIECLNLNGAPSSSHMEQVISKSIQKFAKKSFWWNKTLFKVTRHWE